MNKVEQLENKVRLLEQHNLLLKAEIRTLKKKEEHNSWKCEVDEVDGMSGAFYSWEIEQARNNNW